MKKTLYILLCAVSVAANAASGPDNKAVVRVVSYNAQGDTLAQGYGFFISPDGEAVATFNTLKGAERAEVIDWKGKVHPVTLIKGVNSNYDMVRMKCDAKKMVFLNIAQMPVNQGENILQLYYTSNKKDLGLPVQVKSSEDYNAYKYYTVTTANELRYQGCPLINAQNEVVGVAQYNMDAKAEGACAIDSRFATTLNIGPTSALNADLRSIAIAHDIPADETDAFSYLYMLHRMTSDSVQYVNASTLFAQRFPANIKGYTETASFYAAHLDYAKAEEAINTALSRHSQEDEVHSVLADIIYQKALRHPEPAYKDWTLERALAESQTAYAIKADTTYVMQQAHCLYGLKRYKEAHDSYLIAASHSKAPAEIYYYAANALEHAEGDSTEVAALLNKAVECFERPYNQEAAQYLFARGQYYDKTGQYRAAVIDYKDYELAMGTKNLTHRFYAIRQEAEQKARMYQAAIDDLSTAASISTTTAERGDYLTEIAFIYLRAGMYEEAIVAANEAKAVTPSNADVFKAIGIAHGELGHKADALTNLSRAQALGDTDAQKFIERYSK